MCESEIDLKEKMEFKISILLYRFKENNVHIDNITIDYMQNNMYILTFWYNKKVVDTTYNMKLNDLYYYLDGISTVYSYSWINNH